MKRFGWRVRRGRRGEAVDAFSEIFDEQVAVGLDGEAHVLVAEDTLCTRCMSTPWRRSSVAAVWRDGC
jgi:hypothetical protein